MRFELPTWSSARHYNHYTKEPTVSRKHRKDISNLQPCLILLCVHACATPAHMYFPEELQRITVKIFEHCIYKFAESIKPVFNNEAELTLSLVLHRTRSAAQDTLSPPSPDTHFYCPDNRYPQPLPPQTHSTLCFLTEIRTKREELNCSHLAMSVF